MHRKGLNVLSLFDGMSCGAIALREAGIDVRQYYASEIDSHAIQQTRHNFPDIIQLGSVTDVKPSELPPIDLLIGGSPCQGFTIAGRQKNFKDERSVLFFEYVRILKEIRKYNPDVRFLLENVVMKKEYESVISRHLGLTPVMINSGLVSAQNRARLYWTNIRTRSEANLFDVSIHTDIPLPSDRGIFLKDILEDDVDSSYFLSDKKVRQLREAAVCGGEWGTDTELSLLDEISLSEGRALWRTTGNPGRIRDGPMIISGTIVSKKLGGGIRPVKCGKAGCLLASAKMGGCGQNVCVFVNGDNVKVRRLTPVENCRLQTIPDWYEWICDENRMCQMLGNGWTIDVIKHIFQFLKTSNLS